MCGICGYMTSAREVDLRIVAKMTASMAHRGPDDDGYHTQSHIALGMRRLSIIDVEGGHQPMNNEDGAVWVVYNGEIYNFQELRTQLDALGHVFRSRCDTEVIVHGYEEWGLDVFQRLNGMFGIAIWDAYADKLVLARDPFGVKPLYVAKLPNGLLFASEIRALLASGSLATAVDDSSLDEYFTFGFVASPRTAFRGVRKLLPGHLLIAQVNRSEPQIRRFSWPIKRVVSTDETEVIKELRNELEAAVRRQMIADVPVGVLLSGGMDSTAIASIAVRNSGNRLDTYTVGFEGDFHDNELDFARTTARRLGTAHHDVVLTAEKFRDSLASVVDSLEEPIATASAIPMYAVSALASRHVKVVLTGQGADEPFAGYARYLGERYGYLYRAIPGILRRGLFAPLADLVPRNETLKRAVASLGIEVQENRLREIYSILSAKDKRRLYRDAFPEASMPDVIEPWAGDQTAPDPLGVMLRLDARLSLADNLLMYGDKMSMAHGLEARVPFLDQDLMALVENIPSSMKIRGRVRKWVLREALREWVPTNVLSRRKIGFTTPVDDWFRRELRSESRDMLLDSGSACCQYLDRSGLERLFAEHQVGRKDHKRLLFALLIFEVWHYAFFRKPATTRVMQRPID